jgi:putative ABC transport system permease protein
MSSLGDIRLAVRRLRRSPGFTAAAVLTLALGMALGAAGREIRRAVIRPAVGLAAIGVAVGSAAAWLLGGVLAPDLYEVSPRDPLTFGLVAGILLATAWAACAIPARSAGRLDPLIALRSE